MFAPSDLTVVDAFRAGVVSASSACVLPLLPAIALVVAGVAAPRRRGVLLAACRCGAGFIAGFVLLALAAPRWSPATATAAGVVRVAGGALIVLLAVWVGRRRPRWPAWIRAWLPATAGLALAASWTPCIGPELAILLLQVSLPGAVAAGTARLLVFGAGIMTPVLALAVGLVFATRALGRSDGLRDVGRWVLVGLLLLLGLGTAAGRMAELTGYLARFQPWLA